MKRRFNLIVYACLIVFFVVSFKLQVSAAGDIGVTYSGHVENIGWQDFVSNGAMAGTEGESKRIEAIKINLVNNTGVLGKIEYRTHVQDIGWQEWKSDGEISGTEGQSKRVEAIEIRLTEELKTSYDVVYRVHMKDYGWSEWVANGAMAGTEGESRRIEAVEIKLLTKGVFKPTVKVKAHVQNIGWMRDVIDGNVAGTTGRSLRVEALGMELNDKSMGSIRYTTHIQDIGWVDSWAYDGQISGTVGESKRVEAVKIELVGDIKNYYDIYYSVHIADYGWLDWAKNGEAAGSEGMSLRVEGIKVLLVEKGTFSQGETDRPFIRKPNINYASYVENTGWQGYVSDGAISGTTGKSAKVYSLKMNITDSVFSGGLTYRSYLNNSGWGSWVTEDVTSGNAGNKTRVEAIEVKLTGELAENFDIYYSTHIENVGWTGWAKNGETCGNTGLGLRLEGLKVELVPKNSSAPGSRLTCHINEANYGVKNGVYTIMVNKTMNVVTIYDGDVPIKACICSAGEPTPVGTFYTPEKYRWKALIGGVWGQYSTRITAGYLFHSVPYYTTSVYAMNPISYNKLGTTTSAGCVRLLVGDAKWIYDNCPLGTKVVVYESNDPGPLGKPTAPPLPAGQNWDPTDPNV